jgi:hypothetical protein
MRTRLLADATLTTTLGVATITPMLADETAAPPYVVFSVSDADQLDHSTGALDDITQTISVAVMAASYATTWAVARRIQTLLAGWVDSAGGRWSLLSGPADEEVWAKEGSDRDRLYEVDLEFRVETELPV